MNKAQSQAANVDFSKKDQRNFNNKRLILVIGAWLINKPKCVDCVTANQLTNPQ